MPVTTRKYNPGFLTDDELVASFCVRAAEFEMLVEVLRECTGPSNPHQIVIGPRGSGKTILLLRIAAEVRRDAELSAGFFPVVFAEESYEVGTAGEFWLECLSRVASQAPRREDAPDLHRTFEELRTVRNDQELADRCLGALLDFSDREGKRLVLMVENLGMIFRDMADADAGWRLRKILQTEPRIVLLASATSRFDEIDDPKHALYDFFSVRTLRPLDTSECAALWEAVSGRRPPPGTIRSLEILTGGSPRLITIVARFGAELSFRKLMANLLDLIDDHTEDLKSRLESLPAQERRVYLALAALWKPATTREISEQARMETSKCSAQLTRLIGRGVVQTAGGSARRKQYYLTERLYNIYYLLRRSRTSDRLVEALIHFMESYYSPSELKDIGTRIIWEAEGFGAEIQSLSQAALARLMELPAMAGYRDELLAMIPESLAELSGWGSARADAAKVTEAAMNADSLRPGGLHESADEEEERAAKKLFDMASARDDQNQAEAALTAYGEVVRRFGESKTPTVLAWLGLSLLNTGLILQRLGRADEAVAACDELALRFGESEASVHREWGVQALVIKGLVLHRQNRAADALAVYKEVGHRFGDTEIPEIAREVAKSLVMKSLVLQRLNRAEDALAACDEVVRRFGDDENSMLVEQVVHALVGKGDLLSGMNRPHDALAAYEEVIRRFGEHKTRTVVREIAHALVSKGALFVGIHQPHNALAVYDEVVHRFGEDDIRTADEQVAQALVSKGTLLSGMDSPHEAIDAYDEVVRRFGKDENPAVADQVAKALVGKGDLLGVMNRPRDALAAYDEVVRRFDEGETTIVAGQVGLALVGRGSLLTRMNRLQDALDAHDEVVRRFDEGEISILGQQVAQTLVLKGALLADMNRPHDALPALDEVVRRFGDSKIPALPEWVAVALVHKGMVFASMDRPQESLATYDEVARRFGESESSALRGWVGEAFLGRADIEFRCRRYEAAAETAGRVLAQRQPESPEMRLRGHLIRARATLAGGDRSACARDVEEVLALLPEISPPPRYGIDALMFFSVALGVERMCELVKASPSASLLLPLTTALEMELGVEPRVAQEVKEVAEDIRRDLAKFKETGSYEVS